MRFKTLIYLSLTVIIVNNLYSQNIREIGFCNTPEWALGVSILGDHAFIACDGRGLQVISIANLEEPRIVAEERIPGHAYGIAMQDDYAYIAAHGAGLCIIDISDPEQPDFVGRCHLPNEPSLRVFVQRNYAYVANDSRGLRIINISDPEDPVEVGFFDLEGGHEARDVFVSGDFAYVAWEGRGLRIIDVSDPEQPEEIGDCDTPGWAYGITVVGDYAYVADHSEGFCVIDVSDRSDPEEVGRRDTRDRAWSVVVVGNFAYIANGEEGLIAMDISDPENPNVVASHNTPGYARHLCIISEIVYLADQGRGLRILDISDFFQDIVIEPNALDFNEVNVTNIENLSLAIRNEGHDILRVSNITTEGNGFGTHFDNPIILEPNQEHDQVVSFAPQESGEHQGSLIIESNDLDQRELRVPLRGIGVIRELIVEFQENWNMISINVSPGLEFYEDNDNRGPDVVLMMDQLRIDEDNHHVLLMKNENGRFYTPEFGFNNIPYWDLNRGYQVKVDEDVEAVWSGGPIPADTEFWMNEGWNIVAYFPTYELDAESPGYYVLSPVIDLVEIAKDGNGLFMAPRFQFSNMPPWRETQGYQVKVSEDVVFCYPPEMEGERQVRAPDGTCVLAEAHVCQIGHYPIAGVTGENMSLLVNSISGGDLPTGSQIAAISSDGAVVGSGFVNADGRCGLAVWGDDEETPEVDGLILGEKFELHLWDAESGAESVPVIEGFLEGDALAYETNALLVINLKIQTQLPNEFYLNTAFPNPFNSVTKISYGLPEKTHITVRIYDISGRFVTELINTNQLGGSYTVTWNARNVASGVYLLRMDAGGRDFVRKVVLLQ